MTRFSEDPAAAGALQTLSADQFALLFQGRARPARLVPGAGTSAAAGIPTGYDMIVEFKTPLVLPRHRSRRP